MRLIAEELFLLLTDDVTGKKTSTGFEATALAGALLAELALSGHVVLQENSFWHGGDKAVASDLSDVADPLLAETLSYIAQKPRNPTTVLQRIGTSSLTSDIAGRLVEAGVLEETSNRVLGLFPQRRYPTVDPAPEAQIRQSMHAALIDGEGAEDRIVVIIALLSALNLVPKVLPDTGLPKKELNARAKALIEQNWAAAAVKDTVIALQALVASLAVAAIASSS